MNCLSFLDFCSVEFCDCVEVDGKICEGGSRGTVDWLPGDDFNVFFKVANSFSIRATCF